MKSKRLISIVLTVIMAFLLSFVVIPKVQAAEGEVVIYFTNDTHAYINKDIGFQTVKALKDSTPNSLLVDAGDFVQGTAYGSVDNGHSIVSFMNDAGYDVATIGNHEFDYGMEEFNYIKDNLTSDFISCNMRKEGSLILPAYCTKTVNGVKIGFIGVSDVLTIINSTPTFFQDDKGNFIYSVDKNQVLFDEVQELIDNCKKDGCDYVVALTHMGVDKEELNNTSYDLIHETSGLDIVIDGHSHTVVNETVEDKDGNDVYLAQTGCYFEKIGKITISNSGISINTLSADDVKSYSDETLKGKVDKWISDVDKTFDTQIAESDIKFSIYFESEKDLIYPGKKVGDRAVRLSEVNMGDLFCDALYYYVNEKCKQNCDVAIFNGGGIRVCAQGVWTYRTCKEITPFGATLCIMEVPGRVILEALEFGARQAPDSEFGGFLQCAGIKYDVDLLTKSTVQVDENDIWLGAPTGKYRVRNVKVYNKSANQYEDLDPDKTYRVGGTSYILRNMGNGYSMFTEKNGVKLVNEGITLDYLCFSEYVKDFTDTDMDGLGNITSGTSPLYAKGIVGTNYVINYENTLGSGRINIREVKEDNPHTDDGADIILWIALACMGATGVLFSRRIHR